MKVHGVSLHYFNETQNADKFYRVFIWQDHNQLWHVGYHWGRDGSRGQTKTEMFRTASGVQMALDKKVNEKLSKGYEYLGQGDLDVMGVGVSDIASVGFLIQDRFGRTPTKLPSGFSLVIEEEDDIMDLVTT